MVDSNKKRVGIDFIYNIFASVVMTGTLQIIIYPILAKTITSDEYGVILTVMGLFNTIAIGLGNPLNNLRLLQRNVYQKSKLKGDFNIFLIGIVVISFFIMIIVALTMTNDLFLILTLALTCALCTFRTYLIVEYRLILNFKKNLLCNLFVAIGYGIGLLIYYFLTEQWVLVFFIGELLGVLYVLKTSTLIYEPLRKTDLYKSSFRKLNILISTSIIGNILIYSDRLIILPIIGGHYVTIYTIATFFGKTAGVVLNPLSSVIFSYYSHESFKMDRKRFWQINFYMLLFSLIFMVGIVMFSKIIISMLYFDYLEEVLPFVFIANLAAVLVILGNLTQPSVLKFAPTYWQLIIQISYIILYVPLSIIALNLYGLFGFCWISIIINFVKLFTLYLLGDYYIKEVKNYAL